MKFVLLCAVAALGLASCSTIGLGGMGPNAAAMRDAPDYVRMAGSSDLFEIQSSQAALQTSQNAEVRRFAQMMIDHHTMTTSEVTAAARSSGMTPPPPALAPHHAALLRQLQATAGAARERLYVQQQVTAHQKALALHTGYSRGGDTPALKAVAARAVTVVQQHLTDAQRLRGAAGR
ncbi:MAG TPA: DUF4142 domain-containing protein [Caulobacteraceae bacterium]|nr:DUF4142 domain-containing protein [Caulobacteraceae bacterium]